jgi:hypothetical protein
MPVIAANLRNRLPCGRVYRVGVPCTVRAEAGTMAQAAIVVRRGQLITVLLANAILWLAAIYLAGNPMMGGLAVIALISIATLFAAQSRRS